MIIQEINKQNIDFAISPFGPLMLKGHIDNDEKNKLLEIINNLFSTEGSDQILSGDAATTQNETIKKGKFKIINNDFVNQTIYKIVNSYLNTTCHNIKHEVEDIYEIVSEIKIKITTVWGVLMKDGDYHVVHDHVDIMNAAISGGIYLDVPIDNVYPNGCITWYQPMPGVHLKKNTYTVLPKTNDFIVWPAWLQHSVNAVRSEHDRKMIAFNVAFDDETTTY